MKLRIIALLISCIPVFLIAQKSGSTLSEQSPSMKMKVYNFEKFTSEERVKDLEEVTAMTPPAAQSHPEFGIVPYRTQCENCFELIDKRTADSRYFVENGSGGSTFYVQQIYGYLHYQDTEGHWRTVDHRLKPSEGINGVYAAPYQPVPTAYNGMDGYSSITVGEHVLRYNGNTIMYSDNGSQLTSLGTLDKLNYTVGDDGVRTINAWNSIDRWQIFRQGEIKTDFIINQPIGLPNDAEWLVIEDRFDLPSGLMIYEDQYNGNVTSEGYWVGDLVIGQSIGHEVFRFKRPVITDANPVKHAHIDEMPDPTQTIIAYDMEVNGSEVILKIRVRADWIRSNTRVYPIVIDPLVSGSNTYTAGTMGFRYDGTCWNELSYCAYNMSVTVPGMSTITDAFFNMQYESVSWGCGLFNDCWMSEAAFRIYGPCGPSPASPNYWTCIAPGGNFSGNCSGAGLPATGTVTTCIAPSCPNHVIPFQLRTYYCYCSSSGCPTSCQYVPNNSWVMTVQARTIEATALANATPVTINGSCNVNSLIDANPSFGVPGYTYNWSSGPSPNSQTQTVVHSSNGTYPYTVTVTDACGNTTTTSVNIVISDCPLPVEFESFTGENTGQTNTLYWTTSLESDLDRYEVERSADGTTFEKAGSVMARNNSSGQEYIWIDHSPLIGKNYYRLKTYNRDGGYTLSEILTIDHLLSEGNVLIYNEPQNNLITVNWTQETDGQVLARLITVNGQVVWKQMTMGKKGEDKSMSIRTENLKSGVYILEMNGDSYKISLIR